MTLDKLKSLLDSTGYPVAYSHFETAQKRPFINYFVDGNPNFIADNKTYYKIKDIFIELYTDNKNESAEKILEDILDQNDIPYEPYEDYIESEKLLRQTYEIRL